LYQYEPPETREHQPRGGKMKFPEFKTTIKSWKIHNPNSRNFDNVLRRTISTAKRVTRVAGESISVNCLFQRT